MDIDDSRPRTKVLLSLQRALWGMVTPDIRAVAVGWDTGIIRVRVIFDHAVTTEDLDVVSEIETSVLADFGPGVTTDFTADFSKDPFHHLPGERWWAYVRREE